MSHDTTTPVILCVDDEPPVLRLLKEWPAGDGCAVLPADSGAGALQVSHERRDPWRRFW